MKLHKKVLWITETAVMLALLIALQWMGSYIPEPTGKQLVTGTCVNTVLAVTVLVVGWSSGLTLALVSPVLAFVLKIAPQPVVVPAIMVGNTAYVLLLRFITGGKTKPVWRSVVAWIAAAAGKFLLLYLLVVEIICGVAANALMGKFLPGIDTPLLAPPMLAVLPGMFTWLQLVTALAGGAIALAVWPLLKKALKR